MIAHSRQLFALLQRSKGTVSQDCVLETAGGLAIFSGIRVQSLTMRRASEMRISGPTSSVVWHKRPSGPYFPFFCCRSFLSWWSLAGITTSQTSLSCMSTEENRMAWWSVTSPTGRPPTLGSTIRCAPVLIARSSHAWKVMSAKQIRLAQFRESSASLLACCAVCIHI